MNKQFSLGIVGVRGYVGKDLLAIVSKHPSIKVEWVSSRQLQGQCASTLVESLAHIQIETLNPQQVVARKTDIVVLALPNGLAEPFVKELIASGESQIVIDLSADYRFDDNWFYSVAELDGLNAEVTKTTAKPLLISNPGCYATAMQLAIAPVLERISARPNCFGVSGYSGAGTTPSPTNDPANLADNLIGYSLVEHLHEREVSARLQTPVSFSPHVAAFFRGINMTVQLEFKQAQTSVDLLSCYQAFYQAFPQVEVQAQVPTVKQIVNTPLCVVGGFTVSKDGMRATVVSCLDNLLKGAASQAVQNINLALGLDANTGLNDFSNNKNTHQH